MNGHYTINSQHFSVYLWQDVLKGVRVRNTVTVELPDNSIETPLLQDENGLYIIFNGVQVYLNDYEYLSYDKLIKKSEHHEYLTTDMVLPTLLKETDKVAVEMMVPTIDGAYPFLGINITADKFPKAIMVLSEEDRPKHEWAYKIPLKPADEEQEAYLLRRDLYTLDFIKLIRDGDARLVHRI